MRVSVFLHPCRFHDCSCVSRLTVAGKVDSFQQISYYLGAFMLVPRRLFEAVLAVPATPSVLLGVDVLIRHNDVNRKVHHV